MGMRRFERLGQVRVGGIRVHVARGFATRLLGLAGLRRLPEDRALLIPRCRSVHTFGMRFPIDVVFLDARGRAVERRPALQPNRIASCRRAHAVVETAAGRGGMIPGMANEQNRLANALNPAVPIYRDAYNEYFVFMLSALGASVICPVLFYIIMAFTDLW